MSYNIFNNFVQFYGVEFSTWGHHVGTQEFLDFGDFWIWDAIYVSLNLYMSAEYYSSKIAYS